MPNLPRPALVLIAFLAAAPAFARPKPPAPAPVHAGPHAIGRFGDWQAATHDENGAMACYAFTYPVSSRPALPGRARPVLTVTQRPGGRDEVALSAGFAYPANAAPELRAGSQRLAFYTADQSAFARDGHAVTAAFAHAGQATITSPGPHNRVRDSFSLRGFPAAYAAINKACPAP